MVSSPIYMSAWGKLFKRTLFDDGLKLRFPFGKIFEDQYITHRLFLKADKIVYYNAGMYCWRIVEGSLSRKALSESAARDDYESYCRYLIDLLLMDSLTHSAIENYKIHLQGILNRLAKSNLESSVIYSEIKDLLHLSEMRQ